MEFRGGIEIGLTKVSVFATVIDKYDVVAFRRCQNFPAFVVTVVAGSVIALNPLFVR
jgi:hypothetical protein